MNNLNNLPRFSILQSLSLERLKAEKARRRLREFVEQAWPVLEPHTSFVPGIHVEAICQHLQAVSEGRIKDLIINVPPGHAKSLLTSVFWPAWVWIDHPEVRWIFGSYRAELAIRPRGFSHTTCVGLSGRAGADAHGLRNVAPTGPGVPKLCQAYPVEDHPRTADGLAGLPRSF